ncbi:Piwi-domain-containing protein [Melanomma pulvis-pyrius CBS 109.77]|uniref:Piwi-domain-containing protein n=1 Tax=Melanomma pulvis-pyrius CBS 109.77 TaxID=1314802 RepID=A0A6A6XP12_9PLEO|nr:Piwi-domain-containing protein [Melanomma pulvis-pyrius CBS 109.77]
MPPKKKGAAPAKAVSLSSEQQQSILARISDKPCISCTDHHEAYDCKNLNKPLSMMSWIYRNFPTPPIRNAARAYIVSLQEGRRANVPQTTTADTSATTPGTPATMASDALPAAMNKMSLGSSSAAPPGQPSDTRNDGLVTPDVPTGIPPAAAPVASDESEPSPDLLKVSSVMIDEPVDIRLLAAEAMPNSGSVGPGNVFRPRHVPHKDSNALFPLRKSLSPAHGQVLTNHFEVKFKPNTQFFVYQIMGVSTSKSKRGTKLIIKTAIQAWDFLKNNQDSFATDNTGMIIAWKNLHDSLGAPHIPGRNPGADYTGDNGDDDAGDRWNCDDIADGFTTVSLKFKFCGKMNIEQLQAYTDPARPHNFPNLPAFNFDPIANALNTIISKSLRDDVFQLSANKFFLKSGYAPLTTQKGEGRALCTIRGYFYTIKPGMGKVLLNVNAATSAFYCPLRVDEFMQDSTFPIADREAALRTLRVYIDVDRKVPQGADQKERDHIAFMNKRQNRIKTIKWFGERIGDPEMKFQRTFKDANGEWKKEAKYTRVVDHMRDTFGTPPNPNLKVVNVGKDDDPCYYPQEFLRILPYQAYKRLLPEGFTPGMLNAACQVPQQSRALIEAEGLRKLGLDPRAGLQPFPAMLQIPCTKMDRPLIIYGNNNTRVPDDKNAKWNLTGNVQFMESPNRTQLLQYYMIAVPGLQDSKITTDTYMKVFNAQVIQHGVGAGARCIRFTLMDRARSNMSHMEFFDEIHKTITFQRRANPGGSLVILMLPARHIGAYSAFKDVVDRHFGMQSVCLTEKPNIQNRHCKNEHGVAPYLGNVIMKINLKTGGRNHTAANSKGQDKIEVMLKDTLVLGADVTHPGPGSLSGCPSIAAVVGSVDAAGGKFLGSMRLQHRSNTEIIDELQAMVMERLKAYKAKRNTYPKNILYYRDGVSVGQYEQVKLQELVQIKDAFKTITGNTLTTLTAVVAVKRHHTRLYPLRGEGMFNGNCVPGTLVDSGITSPYFSDFFLQSHHGLKGTAIPTHYFVLENGMGLSEQALQNLTHKLCYTYVRATMGVSYAPPAYYADRLCERGRCYLRAWFAPERTSPRFAEYLRKKASIEKEVKDRMMVVPSVARAGQRKPRKSDAQLEVERRSRAEAKDAVEKHFLGEAKEYLALKRVGGPGPWHAALDDTMFWM